MWKNTTHDWAATVDVAHLADIRADPTKYAPSGALHLVLETIAYPLDEALDTGGGRCTVTLHTDGSVSVRDDGRGTDTRHGPDGAPVRKPIMATKDLRFFDALETQVLPDGHPRRGMSVVAALTVWLVHTNHRRNGAWTQRYEHGIPVTDLVPLDEDGRAGTTVHFMPDVALLGPTAVSATQLSSCSWPAQLLVSVRDEAGPSAATTA
ncbi:ATP-binding protein [Pengzhenrongella phosphoraccumulans]|uniref:ATP-binding protein n=1 Tax=Pengzhenrongella phosphoraccumulans TaxID=3114394 RepID=UPI00389108E0